MRRLSKFLEYHFHNPNYLYLLCSLVTLILLPPLATLFQAGVVLLDISLGVVILMATLYTTQNFKEFFFLTLLGAIVFILFILGQNSIPFQFINSILFLVFFFMVFSKIFNNLLRSKGITVNEVFASIAGYLILGIVAAPFFFLLESSIPGSFNIKEDYNFYDFLYFSYITLTTVGFGDISPIHPLAKSVTLLLGIFGQLYITILVGIIIGKYLVGEQMMENNE